MKLNELLKSEVVRHEINKRLEAGENFEILTLPGKGETQESISSEELELTLKEGN